MIRRIITNHESYDSSITDNAGLDVVVNIFAARYGRILGNENNGTKQVIMLYLSPGHFELLEEA